MTDKEFIAKTIKEGNTNLAQYPAAKVKQMAKKLESSKATAKHIKQHTSTMQGAAQINVLRHNCTSLPPKKKKGSKKPNPSKGTKPQQLQQQEQSNQHQPCERSLNQCTRCGDSPHAQGCNCPAKKYQCKHCTKIGHFTKISFPKNAHLQPQHYHKDKPKQAHQIIVPQHSTKQYKNTHKCDNDDDVMIAFQLRAQPQKNVHNQKVTTGYTQKCLYANIAYTFQSYHKHSKYLHVQLDTCADVNLMPESIYKLVFNNLHTCKLAKNDIDLTVYTRHSVNLIGKCTFYMLSKGTKQPLKVDFYIVEEEGNVLLSQETAFQLQLLDVKPQLEDLPPRATLISSAVDYPKRDTCTIYIYTTTRRYK